MFHSYYYDSYILQKSGFFIMDLSEQTVARSFHIIKSTPAAEFPYWSARRQIS